MRKLVFLLCFLILFSTTVKAESYTCTDNVTSHFTTTITVNEEEIPISYDETCSFGCLEANGKCIADPYEVTSIDPMIILSLFIVGVILLALSFKVDQDMFKHFYWLSGLIFLLAGMITVQIFVDNINKAGLLGYVDSIIWFLIVIFAMSILMLFLMIMWDLMKLLQQKGVGTWIKDKLRS